MRGVVFLFQAEDGIRDRNVTGVQTCALPIYKQLPTTDELLTVFNKLYQLYQRQSSIPKKEEDAAALFDLEEIQWRFLHFQLECHGILRDTSIVYHARNWEKAYDSLCNLIEQRLNIKK